MSETRSVEKFGERLLEILNSGAISLMISIGHRTGLFDIMAGVPAASSQQIAESAGLDERYVREWLNTMTVASIVTYETQQQTYHLPPEHARWLTRKSPKDNLAVLAQYVGMLGSVEDQIVRCFREGGGVPYSSYERFHEIMAEDSGQSLVPIIVEDVVPLLGETSQLLAQGIAVLDVGCGRGRAVSKLAESFPNSTFFGYDLSEEAIEYARAQATGKGLNNVRFEVRDVAAMTEIAKFHLITAFDTIHDQAKPLLVLQRIADALHPEGAFLMQDVDGSRDVSKNMDHPIGPFLYTISCMHCMTVSLAAKGDGLGTMWGRETAEEFLQAVRFSSVKIHRLEHDIQNCFYVARKQ